MEGSGYCLSHYKKDEIVDMVHQFATNLFLQLTDPLKEKQIQDQEEEMPQPDQFIQSVKAEKAKQALAHSRRRDSDPSLHI